MHENIAEILIAEGRIGERVGELGKQISSDYQGKPLLLLGILKGAIVFYSDLMRQINIPVYVDFMAISSYGNSRESSGIVRINKDIDQNIAGKHVLIVEDIMDSGLTMFKLKRLLSARDPASLKCVSLLDKPERRVCEINPDYLGFSIPDKFVVGYGLDYAQQYRNLPYIGVLKPEVYAMM